MAILSESDLKVFIDAVTHFFLESTEEPAHVRTAYLADIEILKADYTGLITLSGSYRGCVYFSAPKKLVRSLLVKLREPLDSEENLLDAVGEVANTISGNARRHFGHTLEISVPVTIKGAAQQIQSFTRTHPYAICLNWHHHEALVVVDIEPVS